MSLEELLVLQGLFLFGVTASETIIKPPTVQPQAEQIVIQLPSR